MRGEGKRALWLVVILIVSGLITAATPEGRAAFVRAGGAEALNSIARAFGR